MARGAPQVFVDLGGMTILIRGQRPGEDPAAARPIRPFADFSSHNTWGTDHFGFLYHDKWYVEMSGTTISANTAPAGANSGSLMTRRWREMDSNPRSPAYDEFGASGRAHATHAAMVKPRKPIVCVGERSAARLAPPFTLTKSAGRFEIGFGDFEHYARHPAPPPKSPRPSGSSPPPSVTGSGSPRRRIHRHDLARHQACRRLQRGVFHSLADPQAAINRHLGELNRKPKPFVWTADPKRIIKKLDRGYQVLASDQ